LRNIVECLDTSFSFSFRRLTLLVVGFDRTAVRVVFSVPSVMPKITALTVTSAIAAFDCSYTRQFICIDQQNRARKRIARASTSNIAVSATLLLRLFRLGLFASFGGFDSWRRFLGFAGPIFFLLGRGKRFLQSDHVFARTERVECFCSLRNCSSE